jgi:HlyD family secretion protein
MAQDAIANRSSSAKLLTRRGVMMLLALTASVGSVAAYVLWRIQPFQPTATQPTVTVPQIKTVTALGRLEPQGEVIKLSAPSSNAGGSGSRVEQLLVKEGDRIQAGQVVAIMDSRDRLQAAVEEAAEQVKVARTKLNQTLAGAKRGEIEAQRAEIERLDAQRQGDIEAQTATVSRLESQLQNAQTEYKRYQMLYQQGAISASERDSKRLTLETAQKSLTEAQAQLNRTRSTSTQQLKEARSTLDRIAEVRPVDVEAAQAEVDRAMASLKQAKANLEDAYVRSPQEGAVLYIHTRPGEVVSNEGIVEIGQTQQMYAIAEVYQTDITKIRSGQPVRVMSSTLSGELQGTVDWIGSKVLRQNVVNTDPSENIDARVVEVHVRLDEASSQKAAKFTNLQVRVVISLN